MTEQEARAMCLELTMDVYRNIQNLAASYEIFILTGGIVVRVKDAE